MQEKEAEREKRSKEGWKKKKMLLVDAETLVCAPIPARLT